MELQGKTVLITGIGGCVGHRLAERAVQAGMRVRGLQRSPDKAGLGRTLGVEMFQGCITDPDVAARACEGVDCVVHAAAIVSDRGALDDFRRVNVQGSVTMAKAARAAGVKTFVQISSVVVYGMDYPEGVSEEGPFYDGENPYCLTKLESEQQVMALNDTPDFGVIVIRPGDVYGPRSLPWVVRPLEMMRGGEFFLLNNGRGVMNHVYVDNLIDGIFLAVEQDAYGEAFNITDGCRTSWKDYYQQLAGLENLGKLKPANAALVKTAIRVFPKLSNVVTADAVDLSTRRHTYSWEKARRVLGYAPKVDLEQGMDLTKQWLDERLAKPVVKPEGDARPELAVFDFDGTLTEKDSFMPFVASIHSRRTLRLGLLRRIRAVIGYGIGIRSNHFIKETLVNQYFKGMSVAELEDGARRYAMKQLPEFLNPTAMERLRWHQAQGHRIVIVSANLEIYLKPWAKEHHITDVIATRIATHQGQVTGMLDGISCYGPEKVNRLASLVGSLGKHYVYAYGDSKGDRELLAKADEPFYRFFPSDKRFIIR